MLGVFELTGHGLFNPAVIVAIRTAQVVTVRGDRNEAILPTIFDFLAPRAQDPESRVHAKGISTHSSCTRLPISSNPADDSCDDYQDRKPIFANPAPWVLHEIEEAPNEEHGAEHGDHEEAVYQPSKHASMVVRLHTATKS